MDEQGWQQRWPIAVLIGGAVVLVIIAFILWAGPLAPPAARASGLSTNFVHDLLDGLWT